MKTERTQAIVSIVTNDYFHQAIILGRSIKRFEKESDFIVFVIGYDERDLAYQQDDFTTFDAAILISEGWKSFVFQYDGLQASCALKPLAIRHLLQQYEKVIYLDSDIKLFGPLEQGWKLLQEADISLTPHSYTPIKDDEFGPARVTMRLSGLFNAGYIGASQSGSDFLTWWWEQTNYNCIIAHAQGIFLDQVYLNDAAYLVRRFAVLRDESYNVACWNLHERALKKVGKYYFINEKPLTFFHFSSYAEVIEVRPPPYGKEIFEELYRNYKKEVHREKKNSKIYPFNHFQDGEEISPLWRDWKRRGIPELEKVKDPFTITRHRREEIEIIMNQREEDYRPKLDREVYVTSALSLSSEEEPSSERSIMNPQHPRAIVAIVTNHYFYQAKALWHSVKRFEKKSDFIVFVIGYDAADPDYQKAGFTVLDAKILNEKKWDRFVFQYHPLEVSCALKPRALVYALKHYPTVIYLDADIELFGDMERGWEALENADLSLTPHNYTPIPPDGMQPLRFVVKMTGIFNAGYVGASRGAISFLEWWWQQTEHNCVTLIYMGVFLDQSYLNYAVTLVRRLHVMEDPTYNVAAWNYHERKLEKVGSCYLVNKKPLTCFHFSGSMRDSAFNSLTEKDKRNLFGELFFELHVAYQRLLSGEKKKLGEKKYPYDHFNDGEKIDQAWREWARRDIPELKSRKNPFSLTRDERETIEEIMLRRPRDFRPNPNREIVLSPAIPYESIYITTALDLTK